MTTNEFAAAFGAAALGGGAYLYLIGSTALQARDRELGITGLVERDVYVVLASSIPFLIFVALGLLFLTGIAAILLKFSWTERAVRLFVPENRPDDHFQLSIILIYAVFFSQILAGAGGQFIGKFDRWIVENSCERCAVVELENGQIIGRQVAGDENRLAVLRQDGSVKVVKWDAVVSVKKAGHRANAKKTD